MADISNSTVFTNDSINSGNTDLLQQAFQQVVDDDERENEFVAFLQSDDNEEQTIHLTPEQAAALGLTFEVNGNEEVTYQSVEDNDINELQRDLLSNEESENRENSSLASTNPLDIEQLDFGAKNLHVDAAEHFEEWHVHRVSDENSIRSQNIENNLQLESINLQNQDDCSQRLQTECDKDSPIQNTPNIIDGSKINTIKSLTKPEDTHIASPMEIDMRYTTQENFVENRQLDVSTNPPIQIFQKIPMLLPSSQLILKPAQRVIKAHKNIRILQNTDKISNNTVNSLNSVRTVNSSNPNSILLSKATLINNMSPQVIKAVPVTTQFLNTNGLSTQLINTSHILTGTCQIANQTVTSSQIPNTIFSSIAGPQNIVTSSIRLSPFIKTSQTTTSKGDIQHYNTIVKSASTSHTKTTQIANTSNVTPVKPAQIIKSVQIPSQVFKASGSHNKKELTSAPVILRTANIIKAQDIKSLSSNSTSILKPLQQSSISVLKPQTKQFIKSSMKSNIAFNTQNSLNMVNSTQNIAQKSNFLLINSNQNNSQIIQNGTTKQKTNINTNGMLKVPKKVRNPTATSKINIVTTTESPDTTKPLGSSENPIQIVQQGQTFHSVQRLTQAQLKQIVHVLQQRSQEGTTSNEKVVYRVVFPEELDLKNKTPVATVSNRGGKRGRPKKNAVRNIMPSKPPPIADEEQEEPKDERKKVIARTRSGRVSRPPRHMVRDYKHIHHLDYSQPDLDDSDGGYSDYNTNSDKLEEEESPKDLLTGLEVPKRKISDHFRCPTCNKIYLGRTRMARHFETHPDHGSPEQLPPSTPDPELKPNNGQDPLKRKGKKRGPWAYVTPEAKSERRQVKLKEAISVCENTEIINIAAKPVLDAQSLFDLLILKSENNVRIFLDELKQLMNKVRERASSILTVATDEESVNNDFINISEELLCDALGIIPGIYKMNNGALKKEESPMIVNYEPDEPPTKIQKLTNTDECKENIEERMSSGFSEGSDLSVSDFMSEKRNDIQSNPTCPEVLSALTLMRRNPSPINAAADNGNNKMNSSVSKLLISNPEIQSQLSESPGFQKIDINIVKNSNFKKTELSVKESFTKLSNNINTSCSQQFPKIDTIEHTFIKLEPTEQGFVKLSGNELNIYQKQSSHNSNKTSDELNSIENGNHDFAKEFQKVDQIKTEAQGLGTVPSKIITTSMSKINDNSLTMLQDTITNACDNNIFVSTENLDMSKMTQYDHMSHLDILNASSAIDKNLLMDEKLDELHLVDQSNLVDELVSERLKNIMQDNILESNLIQSNSNLDTELDFEALSEEFNRNTSS